MNIEIRKGYKVIVVDSGNGVIKQIRVEAFLLGGVEGLFCVTAQGNYGLLPPRWSKNLPLTHRPSGYKIGIAGPKARIGAKIEKILSYPIRWESHLIETLQDDWLAMDRELSAELRDLLYERAVPASMAGELANVPVVSQ